MPTYIQCAHIQFNGTRCGSPALRGDTHCHHHQRYKQSFIVPGSKNYQVPRLDNHYGRARLLSDILRSLMSGAMPVETANTMLRAYKLAAKPYLSVTKEKKMKAGSRPGAPVKVVPSTAPTRRTP